MHSGSKGPSRVDVNRGEGGGAESCWKLTRGRGVGGEGGYQNLTSSDVNSRSFLFFLAKSWQISEPEQVQQKKNEENTLITISKKMASLFKNKIVEKNSLRKLRDFFLIEKYLGTIPS